MVSASWSTPDSTGIRNKPIAVASTRQGATTALRQIDAEQVELVIEFGHLCGEVVPQHALECTGIAVLCTQDRQFPPEAGALLGEFRIDILDDLKSTGDHADLSS